MVYRIDFQHFMTHAIDYFTMDELISFQYMIISAKIRNGKRQDNVVKPSVLYPTPEMVIAYNEYKDPKILRKLYDDYFKSCAKDNYWQDNVLYTHFINPLLNHYNIMMVCDQDEFDYLVAISEYLKDNFAIEVIDLNELFSKGSIGSIYIDRKEIRDKAVNIRRHSEMIMQRSKESSQDGRASLLASMKTKDKLKKLKSLGISVSKDDMKDLDKILVEAWVENNDE